MSASKRSLICWEKFKKKTHLLLLFESVSCFVSCQNSQRQTLKQRIWGCPEFEKGMGSKEIVSQSVVVEKSDVQCFTYSDAKHQHDLCMNKSLASNSCATVSPRVGTLIQSVSIVLIPDTFIVLL